MVRMAIANSKAYGDKVNDKSKLMKYCNDVFGYEITKSMFIEFGYKKAEKKIKKAFLLVAIGDDDFAKKVRQELLHQFLKLYNL